MAVFRGNHPAKVDPKGRLKLPSGFKEQVDEANVTQFYITSTDGKKAEVWPLAEWERQESLLAETSTMDDAVEKYLNLTSYYGQQVEMDKKAAFCCRRFCAARPNWMRKLQCWESCTTWRFITSRSLNRVCWPTH